MRDSSLNILKISKLYIYMVKSHCVKEKKQTECVPGSEKYVKTKNNRTMMKCTCASCGITKTKFVQSAKVTPAMKKKLIKEMKDNQGNRLSPHKLGAVCLIFMIVILSVRLL